MRYLITGGAGFIGSHLAERLLAQGHDVTAIDNLSTGSLRNLKPCEDHGRFRLVIGSILDYFLLEDLIEKCDAVFHLAAAVGVRLIMERPVETIITNVQGSENVLRLANYHDRKVVLASTSEVYGKSLENHDIGRSLKESDDWTLGPTSKRRWAYAGSKAVDEFLALAFVFEKHLKVSIARLFNVVGPRQTGQYGMVVPSFVDSALRNEPLRIHGDGSQTRCFSFVGDVVEALCLLMDSAKANGEVFNIGSEEEISIQGLAEKILDLVGSESELTYVSYEDVYGPGFEDMKRRTPDLSKIRTMLGFRSSHDLERTLRTVIADKRRLLEDQEQSAS